MNKQEFIKHINQLRLANKNKWYVFQDTIENKQVVIKGYNTWLQVFRVNGIQQNTFMDITPTEFKQALEEGVL